MQIFTLDNSCFKEKKKNGEITTDSNKNFTFVLCFLSLSLQKRRFHHQEDKRDREERQNNFKMLLYSGIQTCEMAMIFCIFIAVTAIPFTVHGSLQITDIEYPLMHYTKIISKEHFTAGRPLVILLATAKEDSTNKKVGYLIEKLHSSGRWPIQVYDFSCNKKLNMYTEIHQQEVALYWYQERVREGKNIFHFFGSRRMNCL